MLMYAKPIYHVGSMNMLCYACKSTYEVNLSLGIFLCLGSY